MVTGAAVLAVGVLSSRVEEGFGLESVNSEDA